MLINRGKQKSCSEGSGKDDIDLIPDSVKEFLFDLGQNNSLYPSYKMRVYLSRKATVSI